MDNQNDQEYWVRFMCALASNSSEHVIRGMVPITETADWMLAEMKKRFDRPSEKFGPPPTDEEIRAKYGRHALGEVPLKSWWW